MRSLKFSLSIQKEYTKTDIQTYRRNLKTPRTFIRARVYNNRDY